MSRVRASSPANKKESRKWLFFISQKTAREQATRELRERAEAGVLLLKVLSTKTKHGMPLNASEQDTSLFELFGWSQKRGFAPRYEFRFASLY